MKERVHLSRWKSPKAQARFRAVEAELWRERWPEPPDALDIETHLGSTRAYRWGSPDAVRPPVVFLHGTGGTSLAWSQYADQIGGRTAFAIDTIGDVGSSEQRVAVADGADLATWLDETLAALEIDRAHLVGMSYGGFLALNQAAHAPEHVGSLTLLDPVGIAPIQLARFMRWGFSAMAVSKLPASMRGRAARRLRMPAIEDARIMRMVTIGSFGFEKRLVRPDLTDDKLRAIVVPVLLVVPDRSEVHDVATAVTRARTHLRDVEVRTITGAGHALPISHPNEILAAMNEFLDRQEATTA